MLRDRDIRPRFRVQRRWRAIKLRMGVYYDNIVRVGKVSSVDVNGRMVRVAFEDKLDTEGKPLISGKLKVLQNQPLITVEKWVEELGTENKWDYEAYYNSQGRGLNLGESYVSDSYEDLKDVIKNEKIIKYEKRETINENAPIQCLNGCSQACACGAPIQQCPIHGVIENKKHRQTVTVYPWLPFVGQLVVCLFLPYGESDGFVLGGI